MSRMLLDFDDDELSDCSIGDEDDDLLWDTDSTSTDSMYANDLLGTELFTIWELESYQSDQSSEEGDDDIASIASEELIEQEEKRRKHNHNNNNNNKVVVVSHLPSEKQKVSSGEPHQDEEEDDLSIDSTGGYEERWHVDESGKPKKSAFQDASWERDMKRREIQRKMRVLEQRISAIRGIVEPDTDDQDQHQQRRRRPGGRRRVGRSPGRGRGRSGRKKHRSLSPNRLPNRSKSPPRNSTFNDTLENRRKQVALARQKLQERLISPGGGGGKSSSSDNNNNNKRLTNPRHLHRQAMKRMNPNVVPSRFRTV